MANSKIDSVIECKGRRISAIESETTNRSNDPSRVAKMARSEWNHPSTLHNFRTSSGIV